MYDSAKITCPFCQALNPEHDRFCQQCGKIVPKLYLYALGKGLETFKEGQLLAERYLVKSDRGAIVHIEPVLHHNRIVLDTKPGLLPEFPSDIPPAINPYLRLFPYKLHLPQAYGVATLEKKGESEEVWLLEQAPLYEEPQQRKNQVKVGILPELTSVWQGTSPLRQLNWLWQMGRLWQPFTSVGVASSLLSPTLLRVERGLVRFLELQLDRSTPTLKDLGQLWREWVEGANPIVAEFLTELCEQMMEGGLAGDRLVAQLDLALTNCGKSLDRSYQVITRTDKGPSRQRNEDACYPQGDNPQIFEFPAQDAGSKQPLQASISTPLAIVCDGIGGHEGGSIASNLAVETIQQHLEDLKNDCAESPENLENKLELAACAANDQISRRNDVEGRQQRQRMGTTLVMALAYGHEVYITHVGDSRAYWISRSGCYQVTLDDDVASREVRLGYALYREALQQMGSGSLVQALGMGSSMNLHPTVQRFVVDEDCVFLLCSDGLSDGDRVEQSWEEEILPVLEGKVDLADAAARLIEIGNTLNGHDNVTVGLVHFRVNFKPDTLASKLFGLGKSSPASYSQIPTIGLQRTSGEKAKTLLLRSPRPAHSLLPLVVSIALLLGVGFAIARLLIPEIGQKINSVISNTSPSPSSQPALKAASSSFTQWSWLIAKGSAEGNTGNIRELLLLPQQIEAQNSATVPGQKIVPAGSILQVIKREPRAGKDVWLNLKVCWLEKTASGGSTIKPATDGELVKKNPAATKVSPLPPEQHTPLQTGDTGWIKESDLSSVAQQTLIVPAAKQGQCSSGSG